MIYKYSRGGFDDMKHKGEQDFTIDAEEHGEAAAARDDRKWYEKIHLYSQRNNIEIPHVKRPKGKGVRLDFYTESQMPDMALQIKESGKGQFKNSNDVHRAAHYIGMYLMRQSICYGKGNSEKDILFDVCDRYVSEHSIKESIHAVIGKFFESYYSKIITEEQLSRYIEEVLNGIKSEEVRKWVLADIDELSKDPGGKVYERLRKRAYREKQKELNLSVVKTVET
jgi:hypothetical protein